MGSPRSTDLGSLGRAPLNRSRRLRADPGAASRCRRAVLPNRSIFGCAALLVVAVSSSLGKTYSVQGAAEALSISTQTVFKWLQKGRLSGHQITKGMPWQINLSNTQIVELRTQVRRTTLSKKEAS
jgi:excisionase family DNA binding protein